MPRLIYSLIVFVSLVSCSKSTGIKELIITSDSAAINFYKGNGSMDTVYKVAIVRDKKELEKLAVAIESATIKNTDCGYDGSLHFFKNNVVLKDIDFRMNDANCMHFSFNLKGQLFNTKLSPEIKQLLESLKLR
jgi:hypothetical protein